MSEEIEIDTTKDTNDDNVLNLENSEFDLSLRIDHFEDEGEQIRFIKGRLKFGDSKQSAPFPSMIVVFK